MQEAANPTLMGIDVIFVATLLAAVATLAVLIAIYAATTVRDPMAKRVKALNERREQLKAESPPPPPRSAPRSFTRTTPPTRCAARCNP